MRRVRAREERIPALIRGGGRLFVTALITLVTLSVGVRLYLEMWPPEPAQRIHAAPGFVEQIETRQHLARLHTAVHAYAMRHGRYPESLQALVGDGFIRQNALRYPDYHRAYYYRATSEAYTLAPPSY